MADRKNNETTSWNADEVRRQQTQRKQRKKMRRTRFWAIYCAGVVLGSCLLAGLGWLMVNDVCALNKAPLTATVEIEKGDSVGQPVNRPTDMKPAWPSDSSPSRPTTRFRDTAMTM